MDNKRYFKLYSIPLLRFIKAHGMKPLSKGVNKVTGKTFWLFEMDDELSRVLTIWTNNNPNKNK